MEAPKLNYQDRGVTQGGRLMVLRYRPSGLPSHRIDFIEKAGTGIRRIRDGAKAVDCPEPAFEAGNFVTVTFRPNPEVRRAAGVNWARPRKLPPK